MTQAVIRTYLSHWGLSERPFGNDMTGSFFFTSRQHREALERVLYLVRDGGMGFGLLTGEIGCGKTAVLNMAAYRLQGTNCLLVKLENTFGSFDDVLVEMLSAVQRRSAAPQYFPRRVVREESRYERLCRFRQLLRDRVVRQRRQMVLLLDEAQQLSEDALIELKNLTNLDMQNGACPLSILLAGQPELGETIQGLPQIDQRVGVRFHLLPLPEAEVGEYVDARMRAAGYRAQASAFSDEAKALLAAETGGIPREINRICKLALDRAFSLGRLQVDIDLVLSIAGDVFSQKARVF